MSWRPRGMRMWDAWFIENQGTAHAFYIQRLVEGSARAAAEQDDIGHATSTDLVTWTECAPAVKPGAPGRIDDNQPWTGCTYSPDGKRFFLYYTMRSRADDGNAQRIGLSQSTDLFSWTPYHGNPVIVPDPARFVSHEAPLANGVVDCRDLLVLRDPGADRYLGYFAARTRDRDLAGSACIAVVESRDLVHWSPLDAAFAPGRFACLEVPDVFELDGRWYLTAIAGHAYGNRGFYSDAHITEGTVYAVSDRPTGPFREIPGDNVLIGATRLSGFTCRTLVLAGKRYLFYTEPDDQHTDVLTIPKELRTDASGRLRAVYSDRYQVLHGALLVDRSVGLPAVSNTVPNPHWPLPSGAWSLAGGRYRGVASRGWQVGELPVDTGPLEVECRLTLVRGAAAGLSFGTGGESPDDACAVYLDAEEGTAACADLPRFVPAQRRSFAVERGRAFHLRLVLIGMRVELFVDDVLLLQFSQRTRGGNLGLFVDRGEAIVEDLQVTQLTVPVAG